ncbi:Serine/threonine-protein kinase PK-1 [compost metagenome]
MLEFVLKRNTKLGGEGITGTDTSPKYRVRSVISVSELAVVYVARNETEGIKCIIKEFCPNRYVYRGKDGSTLRRKAGVSEDKYIDLWNTFMNESELLDECKHPGIVQCLDRFEQNGTAYIVMEFCEGVTLDKYIMKRKSEMDPEFLYKTMIPLMKTLEYLHRSGIIHRDLKPGNIIIGEDGVCKLLDFGSAVRVEDNGGRYLIFTTAGYSPLELYSEQSRQGPMSDIYSFAAVLYYCIRGVAPTDVRKRLFDERLEPLGTGMKRSWPFLSRVIHWGLAVSADKRCSSLKWFKLAIMLERLIHPSWRTRP